MTSRSQYAALILGLMILPSLVHAQTPDTAAAQVADPILSQSPSPAPSLALGRREPDETVIQYDLSGPRLGVTFAPDGTATSQFGWHFEHQAAPGTRGPWFIVERVFLIGGMEQNVFMPSGTLVFGLRLPNSFEFGVGPSATLGGREFFNTAIVIAAGQSFRAGGIRIPVNAAVAVARNGENRYTLVTGWAIRETFAR